MTGNFRPTAGHRLAAREIAGLTIAQAAYQPHARTPWHSHAVTGVEIVLDGGYVKRTKRSDYQCASGVLTVEPPGETHAGVYGPTGWRAVIVEFTPAPDDGIHELAPALSSPLCRRDTAAHVLGRRAWVELSNPDAASGLALEGIALELIAVAVRAQTRRRRGTASPAWLRVATERLRDEFRRDIRLSELAAGVGVHPVHLARAFRAHEGCSIGEFVRRHRVEWAARELSVSTAPVATIALDAGFYDQSHFARIFKEHFGVTPARYRNVAAVRRDSVEA